MKIVKRIGFLAIWLLIILPIPLVMVGDDGSIISSLSRAFGLASATALSLSFMLGPRTFWHERLLISLSKAYRLHHQTGLASFIFILLHLVFSAFPFIIIDLSATWDFLGDFQDPTISSGWSALLLIIIGIAFSYFKKWGHNTWLFLHRIFVLSIPLVFIHLWTGSSHLGPGEFLTLSLLFIALVVISLHYLAPHTLRKNIAYNVIKTKMLGPTVIEVTMRPEDLKKQLQFVPGQFVYLSVNCTKGCGVSHEFHPFTLASPPGQEEISMAIRSLGDDSGKLLHLTPDNKVTIEGPYGNLLSDMKPNDPQLWIAGGIGITPFISYIRYWSKTASHPLNIVLIIFVRHAEDNFFKMDIIDLKGVKTLIHTDENDGPPNLVKLLPADWDKRKIALSGPISMVTKMKSELKKMGAKQIYSEEFKI